MKESSVEVIMKEFEEYPKHLEDDVWLLSSIMSGSSQSLDVYNPKWSEARRQRFLRKVWSSRNSYRRDVLNQPYDGVTWPLENSHGYGEEYTVALLDHITELERCQPQIYAGYARPKSLKIGDRVMLAIHGHRFEGQIGSVISRSSYKWVVSFPNNEEDSPTLTGHFYEHELLELETQT